MHFRNLGQSGLRISSIALGTDNFVNPTPAKEAAAMLAEGLDAGIKPNRHKRFLRRWRK